MPFLFLLATSCFVGSLSMRLLDPVVPQVARDLSTSPEAVALLSTAFLLSYAITQPFVGAIADAYGKVRILKICSAALALMMVMMTFAPSIEVLYAARVFGGIFGGGVFTVALSIVGDRVAASERQVALSRLIMASQSAQLFGVIAAHPFNRFKGQWIIVFDGRLDFFQNAFAQCHAFFVADAVIVIRQPQADRGRQLFRLLQLLGAVGDE